MHKVWASRSWHSNLTEILLIHCLAPHTKAFLLLRTGKFVGTTPVSDVSCNAGQGQGGGVVLYNEMHLHSVVSIKS